MKIIALFFFIFLIITLGVILAGMMDEYEKRTKK